MSDRSNGNSSSKSKEYNWYLVGCSRYGYDPVSEAEFVSGWLEFEEHAEKLKIAEKQGALLEIDAETRAKMQNRIQDDPLVKAVLVGMAEDPAAN